jgi:hypothetical protein
MQSASYFWSIDERKVKAGLSGLSGTDAYWHIVSLPLTVFTAPSPDTLHTKQA